MTYVKPRHKGQTEVVEMREAIGSRWPMPDVLDSWAFLVTEIGEIGDALLRLGYGHGGDYLRNHARECDIRSELADAYLMLCTLASLLEIDLGEALEECIDDLLEKYCEVEK